MLEVTDHTCEVEKRVAAIPVRTTDRCAFFTPRESALLPRRECWYCVHGKFEKSTDDPRQEGYCKFKK